MDLTQLSEEAIRQEIGRRLRRQRLNQNVSQVALATRSGVSRAAVQGVEGGADCTLTTLIRLLRGLGVLDQLDLFLPDPGISPIQIARLQGKVRQRASAPRDHERRSGD